MPPPSPNASITLYLSVVSEMRLRFEPLLCEKLQTSRFSWDHLRTGDKLEITVPINRLISRSETPYALPPQAPNVISALAPSPSGAPRCRHHRRFYRTAGRLHNAYLLLFALHLMNSQTFSSAHLRVLLATLSVKATANPHLHERLTLAASMPRVTRCVIIDRTLRLTAVRKARELLRIAVVEDGS